jgi:tetratricopeptide (TPR) repeat protein
MKINTIIKISLISILSLAFISCNDTKDEQGLKATLPMPSTKGLSAMGLIGKAHDAKKDPIPATKIGYAYSEELKDYKKAIQWYKYSDSMKPMPENSNYACYAYQQLKQYEEAITWCTNAVELGSDEALFQLGTTYFKLNKFDKSLELFKKSFDKGNENALTNIAFSYSKLKDYKNAEIWYIKAIKNKDLTAYQDIATFYYEDRKDYVKASAYSIALIDIKYRSSSVLNVLQNKWKIPNETIKKGYKYQLNSKEIPIKYTGKLEL